jgi:Ca2+-binding EF-hand superfamily protein
MSTRGAGTLSVLALLVPHLCGSTQDLFSAMDVDGSGGVDERELTSYFRSKGHEPPSDLFSSEDLDLDGVISYDEFTGPKGPAPPQVVRKGQSAAAAATSAAQAAATPHISLFAEIDADGDGRITWSEFAAVLPMSEEAEQLFDSDDVDGDGVISWREFTGPGGGASDAGTADGSEGSAGATDLTSGGGGISLGGRGGGGGGAATAGATTGGGRGGQAAGNGGAAEVNVFKSLDVDADGVVTQQEFFLLLPDTQQNRALFDREDKDNDGFIVWIEFDGEWAP